ncbi:DEAD/DEAH box helicase family protein, partial [bacterium]|nr:DEAD/DEAH box helicase family protein [bacterium]
MTYRVEAPYDPAGDQPRAIAQIVDAFQSGEKDVTLLGVTGSGKTFTMSKVIEALGMPALILTHNKTLAAQLFEEFRGFFPHDPVGYFVSYYDYYQPEAYLPHLDKYIEKDAKINPEITRLRHHATRSLLTSPRAVVVASVSCIYGLGSPEDYRASILSAKVGQTISPTALARSLIAMGYEFVADPVDPGTFHRRGGLIDIYPSDTERIIRLEWFGDEIDAITHYEPISRHKTLEAKEAHFFPASHYVIDPETLRRGVSLIKAELKARLAHFHREGLLLEAQRLEQRALYDLESIAAYGTVKGIENYSRHFQGREEGEPPPCLVDYFHRPFLTIVDESHVTLPQVRGMVLGDRS